MSSPVSAPAPRRSSAPESGPLRPTVRLGRIAGVEIGLNWTWALVLGLIVWSLTAQVFPAAHPGLSDTAYLVMGVVAAVAFFACLLAHELGHAVQARREGMRIEGITLWLFGGVARFSGMFPSAGAELRIALAGPLVTLVLGVLSLAGAALIDGPATVDGVLGWLGSVNLMLLGFNLLPALPLDGGRVLRAALWHRSGDFTRATRTAGAVGVGIGRGLIGFGFLLAILGALGGLWLALIGWFVSSAATAEAQVAEISAALAGETVRDVMVRHPDTADADATLAAFVDEVFADSRHTAYPVVEDGEVIGELTFRAIAGVRREDWPWRRVREVMIPAADALVLDADAPLAEATVELMGRPPSRALVSCDGRLSGMLSISDVARLLELRRLAGPPPR